MCRRLAVYIYMCVRIGFCYSFVFTIFALVIKINTDVFLMTDYFLQIFQHLRSRQVFQVENLENVWRIPEVSIHHRIIITVCGTIYGKH